MKATDIFTRVEKKYMVTPEQLTLFMQRAKGHVVPDEYGSYTVFNVYFDSDDNRLIRASIEKPAYKEKLRLRSYGKPSQDDTVFLELKKKCDGVVYKRRSALTLKEAREYTDHKVLPKTVCNTCDSIARGQILREIDYTVRRFELKPKVFLAYERTAWKDPLGSDLRVTFDTDIRSRTCALDLGLGGFGIPVDTRGRTLMEIKVMGAAPLWLARTLSDLGIYPEGFSKYGAVYTSGLERRDPVGFLPESCAAAEAGQLCGKT